MHCSCLYIFFVFVRDMHRPIYLIYYLRYKLQIFDVGILSSNSDVFWNIYLKYLIENVSEQVQKDSYTPIPLGVYFERKSELLL